MWLLPQLPRLSRWIAGVMHRISAIEGQLPPAGPVLLVANHPNALIDPVVATAAAGRPVRWLAKSTLVFQPAIGWLFRAAGAIPVYRRQDDATQMDRNTGTFAAAIKAMREGSVVGLFPEGISHTAPSLAPLKTGAARLALQAAVELGTIVPIIPVGVIYRNASTFRSPAGVIIGEPVRYGDLVNAGPEDRHAVEELTERIGASLGGVTRQLNSWADQRIVELAASIVAAENPTGEVPPSWIARASGMHTALEAIADPALPAVKERLQRHAEALRQLRLTPAQLAGKERPGRRHWWSGWRAPLVALVWFVGIVWTWIPYRATGPVAERLTPHTDLHTTLKAVVGLLFFLLWIVLTAIGIGLATGWIWGAVALPLGVALALWTLRLEEARLAAASADRARSWRVRPSGQRQALVTEQHALAADLASLADRSLEDSSANPG